MHVSSIDTHVASDTERNALGSHAQTCRQALGRSFGLRCAGERVHAVLGPRFFTTVLGATVLLTLLAGGL